MFHVMSMPSPVLAASVDLEQLTSDLVASMSGSPRGGLNGALQHALAHTVEAKVNAQLAVVLEGIGDAFYSLDADWRFSYINRTAESYFGVPRHTMLHRMIWDAFPESEGTELRRRYEEIFASGRPLSFEAEAVGRQGALPGVPRPFPITAVWASASATGRIAGGPRRSCAPAKPA